MHKRAESLIFKYFLIIAIILISLSISNCLDYDSFNKIPNDADYFDGPLPIYDNPFPLCLRGFVYHDEYCYSWSSQKENMQHPHTIPQRFDEITQLRANSSEFNTVCDPFNTHPDLKIGIANFDRKDELKNIELAFKVPNEAVTEYYVKYNNTCAVITFKDNNLTGPEASEDCGINQKYFICRYRANGTYAAFYDEKIQEVEIRETSIEKKYTI